MTETIELALKTLEVQLNQPLETALEACARCGICAEACHYYRAEPKVEHIPAYRAEQLRSVYRHEHDFLSRLFPVWTRSKKLDEPMLDILNIRRDAVLMQSEFPNELQGAFKGMERQGNPWQAPREDRFKWAK